MSDNSESFVELVAGLLGLAHAAQAFAAQPGAVEELQRILYIDHHDCAYRGPCTNVFSSYDPPVKEELRVVSLCCGRNERQDENDRCIVDNRVDVTRSIGSPSSRRRTDSKVSRLCDIVKEISVSNALGKNRSYTGGSALSVLRSIGREPECSL